MRNKYTPKTMLRLTRVSEPSATKGCRVRSCSEHGYNRYCWKHTPTEGAGMLKCHNCGKPYSKHESIRFCEPVSKANQGGTS